MTGGHPDPGAVTFAFASGFAGVMLSPTHLCLVLTLQYFKADMAGTYRLLYLPVGLVFLVRFDQALVVDMQCPESAISPGTLPLLRINVKQKPLHFQSSSAINRFPKNE